MMASTFKSRSSAAMVGILLAGTVMLLTSDRPFFHLGVIVGAGVIWGVPRLPFFTDEEQT